MTKSKSSHRPLSSAVLTLDELNGVRGGLFFLTTIAYTGRTTEFRIVDDDDDDDTITRDKK